MNNGSPKIWNLPNKITLARVFMIPLFVALFIIGGAYGRLAAGAVFVLAAVTDWADGYIARKYNLITNLGKFMDPLADKLLVCAALVMLAGVNEIPSWAVVIIISREFIVTGFRTVAASSGVVIAAGYMGKVKTAVQMVMLIALIPDIGGYIGVIWFDYVNAALLALCVGLTVLSGAEYIIRNIDVLRAGE